MSPIEFHDEPNVLPRLESIWVFLSVADDGSEGVVAAKLGGNMLMPLVAADKARLEKLWPIAEDIASITSKRIVLARFTARVDEGAVEPG